MSIWHFISAPFGGVVFSVCPDGGVIVRPGTGVKPVRDYASGADTMAPADEIRGEPAVWTFNGKPYSTGVNIEIGDRPWNLGEPVVSVNRYDAWTESARRQVSEWLVTHYPELATPRRISEARLSAALAAAHSAEEDAEKAEKAAQLAREAVEAARADLEQYGA